MDEGDRMEAIWKANGYCPACGWSLGNACVVHHRQAKGMGGRKGGRRDGSYTDRPPFTEALHDYCHKWLHANVARARETGHIVPSWESPGRVEVLLVPELREARR